MTVFVHELRRARLSLILWTAVVAFMLAVCVMIYPEMAGDMDEMSQMFSDMGSFSAAFGMDKLNFGEFMGYFGIECGNVLGIGGAMFAAILGVSALSKEEKDQTAEWLLTHPVSRGSVLTQKLAAVIVQVLIFNIGVAAVTAGSIVAIGEQVEAVEITLVLLSYAVLQLEIALMMFGVSAFLRRGGMAVGIGAAFALYFLNLVANLIEEAEWLKFITPFGYTDSAYIVEHHALDPAYVAVGAVLAVALTAVGAAYYAKKDIH